MFKGDFYIADKEVVVPKTMTETREVMRCVTGFLI
jgi:hypothetical protein